MEAGAALGGGRHPRCRLGGFARVGFVERGCGDGRDSHAFFGGVVGSALNAPRVVADASYSQIQQGMGEVSQAMERLRNLEGMSAQQIRDAAPRTEREFGAMSDEELGRNISSLEARASRLMETAEEGPGGQTIREQAQEIQAEVLDLRTHKKIQ